MGSITTLHIEFMPAKIADASEVSSNTDGRDMRNNLEPRNHRESASAVILAWPSRLKLPARQVLATSPHKIGR